MYIIRVFLFTVFIFCVPFYAQQNVVIVIVDGARYSETFGGADNYIPHLYNDLKPAGTFYNNFYIQTNNPAVTLTLPGHTAVLTGNWEAIANDGTERSSNPTLFEYFRKYTGAAESDAYVIGGKEKLDALTYSNHLEYGQAYKASSEVTGLSNDVMIYNKLIDVMNTNHPRLILVNFTQTDVSAHSGSWNDYVFAIHQADSLIYALWQSIQSHPFYSGSTTLLITNDHGRHDDANGGFQNHGDNCEGCRHIMLLALGPNVTVGQEISDLRNQIDITQTVAELMSFPVPFSNGSSLFSGPNPLSVELSSFNAERKNESIFIEWTTQSEMDNYGFEIQRRQMESDIWKNIGFVEGNGNTNIIHQYTFIDDSISGDNYFYRLKQIDSDGKYSLSKIIEVKNNIDHYELYQNFPNPFNPNTKIRYTLAPSLSKVERVSDLSSEIQTKTQGGVKTILKVYDILSNEVATLVNEQKPAGNYEVEFDASHFSSGIYFYSLNAGDFFQTKKMILLK